MALTKISRGLLSTGISDSSDATAITIDSSENVLVGSGTSNGISGSTTGLQVAGAGFAGMISATRHDNNAYSPALMLGKSRNTTVGSNTIVQSGDEIGAIGFFADDGTNLDSQVAYIRALVDGTPGENDTPGRLTFSTTADGSAAATERMRIDSSGNLGIGTTSPTEKLEVAGNIFVNTSGNPNLTVKTSGAGNNPYVRIQADSNYWDLQTLFSNANDELDFRYNGTSTLKIDNAGHVTKPLQPYFLAYRSGNQAGFNSAGNYGAVVQYNAEIEDINGDFNTSNGLFTAPVDGTYWFIASAYGSSFQQAWLAINTGSGASRATYTDFNVGGYSGDVFTAVFYVNLDANDTVGYHPYTSTSTNVTIIANAYHTWFKGGLLY
jgi:hypothetical protein